MKTSWANAEPDAVEFFWGYVNDEGGVLFSGQRLYGMGRSVKWRSAKWVGQWLYGMGRNVKWGDTHQLLRLFRAVNGSVCQWNEVDRGYHTRSSVWGRVKESGV